MGGNLELEHVICLAPHLFFRLKSSVASIILKSIKEKHRTFEVGGGGGDRTSLRVTGEKEYIKSLDFTVLKVKLHYHLSFESYSCILLL